MKKSWMRTATVAVALGCAAAPAAALAGGSSDNPPPPPPPAKNLEGRMTGGGKAFGSFAGKPVKVTHGFTLRCDASDKPQRLEVNWSNGGKFHLEDLTSATCSITGDEGKPEAGFDTYVGAGVGRDGEKATWRFTDYGEPGRDDRFEIKIVEADGKTLVVNDDLSAGGNHQAHRLTGSAAR